MKIITIILFLVSFNATAQSDGIDPDNAVLTLGNLTGDIWFGNGCDEHQLVATVDGDVELNDKILSIGNAKIRIHGNIKKNGLIIDPNDFDNFEQLRFECGSNSIIELIQ